MITSRSEYDRDYIGHYATKQQRKGHTDRITNLEAGEEKRRTKDDEHRQFGYGEDRRAQIEAKDERVRAREERNRRMGFEVSDRPRSRYS